MQLDHTTFKGTIHLRRVWSPNRTGVRAGLRSGSPQNTGHPPPLSLSLGGPDGPKRALPESDPHFWEFWSGVGGGRGRSPPARDRAPHHNVRR